jgi:hypothetical protein
MPDSVEWKRFIDEPLPFHRIWHDFCSSKNKLINRKAKEPLGWVL